MNYKERLAIKEQARSETVKKRELIAAKEQARLESLWRRELGYDCENPLEVIVAKRRDEKKVKEEFNAKIPQILTEAGWAKINEEVWSRPNWKKPGTCYATLKQAFKIHLGGYKND